MAYGIELVVVTLCAAKLQTQKHRAYRRGHLIKHYVTAFVELSQ